MLISKNDTNGIEEHIVYTEEVNGVKFPAQYRNFLLKYNGGKTPETTFKIGKIKSDIQEFIGVGNAELNISKLKIEWDNKKYSPIARDSYGNYIFIGLERKVEGQIFYRDHEREDCPMKFLTEDFNSLIKVCKSKKIDENSKKTVEEREADLISRGFGHNISESLKKMWQKEHDKFINMVQERVVL